MDYIGSKTNIMNCLFHQLVNGPEVVKAGNCISEMLSLTGKREECAVREAVKGRLEDSSV